jgi:small neutral amino acid transporter SnatA (MarC family)
MRFIADTIFLLLFFVLLATWALAWTAFHVAGGLIHLLLVIAVISLVMHLVRSRREA